MKCICGSQDIDYHESSGHAVCCTCGRIIEENTIVSSLEFEETGDRSHVIGQYISSDGNKISRSNVRFRNRSSTNQESRSITMNSAKRAIQQVASVLRLPFLFVDKAHKLYGNALKQRFMFGRQQSHVVAACLYTICRIEKSPHLLIDFSDALQVNVYVLGKTFMEFSRLLKLQEQFLMIDPALFIHRFASRFNLGDEINSVISTSLRIITRMKKDWITTGRRPDGICAAAMMISMRCHGIHRTQVDIGKIFRVSQSTLKTRLDEFKSLPASQMSIHEFNVMMPTVYDENNIATDDGFDPPAFIRNRIKEEKLRIEQEKLINAENGHEEGVDNEDNDDTAGNELSTKVMLQQAKLSMYEMISAGIDEADDIVEDLDGDTTSPASPSIKQSKRLDKGDSSDMESMLLSEAELDDYILTADEQIKRAAIFDQSFKVFLDERAQRRGAAMKEQSKRKPKDSSEYAENVEMKKNKKSKKINYEAQSLSQSFQGDDYQYMNDAVILEPTSTGKRKTIKAGTSMLATRSSINQYQPDLTNTRTSEVAAPYIGNDAEEEEDLIYDDNYDMNEYE